MTLAFTTLPQSFYGKSIMKSSDESRLPDSKKQMAETPKLQSSADSKSKASKTPHFLAGTQSILSHSMDAVRGRTLQGEFERWARLDLNPCLADVDHPELCHRRVDPPHFPVYELPSQALRS